MKKIFSIIAVISLAGCVTTSPQRSQSYTPVTEPTPTCQTQQECEAMWIEASDAVSQIGGMRVAIQTDSVIETYNSTRIGNLRGRVTKSPLPGSGYEIRVSFSCPQYGCESLINPATNLFNHRVSSAGIPFRATPVGDAPAASSRQDIPF